MTSAKHTPGPWVVDVERRSKRSPVTGLMVVAEKGGMPGLIVNQPPIVTAEDWANAHLIAAAPDLLRALEKAEKLLFKARWIGHELEEIAAAIAKAKGEA